MDISKDEEIEELVDKIAKKSFKIRHPILILEKKQHLKDFFQSLGSEEKEQLSGVTTLEEFHEGFCKNQRLEKPKFVGFVRVAGGIPYNCFLDCKCGFCQTKKKNRKVFEKSWCYGL